MVCSNKLIMLHRYPLQLAVPKARMIIGLALWTFITYSHSITFTTLLFINTNAEPRNDVGNYVYEFNEANETWLLVLLAVLWLVTINTEAIARSNTNTNSNKGHAWRSPWASSCAWNCHWASDHVTTCHSMKILKLDVAYNLCLLNTYNVCHANILVAVGVMVASNLSPTLVCMQQRVKVVTDAGSNGSTNCVLHYILLSCSDLQ